MAKALTAAALEKYKPEKSRKEIPDGLLTGLYFIVQPTGRKSWAVRYRHHGKPRKLVLGSYPALDLSAARDMAKEKLRSVQEGRDPAADKQVDRQRARDDDTAERTKFETVVRTFLSRHAKPKNRSWRETARQFGLVPGQSKTDDPKEFEPVKGGLVARWGHRPVEDISRGEIISLMDEIVDRGAPVLANRTLSALRKLFNWAIARDMLDDNPCDKVKPPAEEKARDRVLTDDELRALWNGCEAIDWPFGPLFQILLLTGQRREEVGSMEWKEIEGDTWTIPRERVKTDRAQDVPLNAQATAIIDQLPHIKGKGFVFTTNGNNPVSGYSKAKAALDGKMLEFLRAEAEKHGDDPDDVSLPHWRLHDIRRTVASGMARLGISLAVIEKILNHTSGSFGGIVGVYQRHEFADEKRKALEAWGKFVMHLLDDNGSKNVVRIEDARS